MMGAAEPQAIYEADKIAAEICREMQLNGFLFDQKKGVELASFLEDLESKARDRADDAVGRKIKKTKTGGFGTNDLQDAFFADLRAPIFFRSELTGRPSLGVDALRAYAACKDANLRALSLAILEWRRARKIRKTYIENVPIASDGRVHPSWLNYGAVSGRWACQQPNLMNLPRASTDPTRDLGGVRSLYRARNGFVIAGFDAKQLEMRIAAYASGDEAMIEACESSDLHSANAEIIFGEAFTNASPAQKKALRTLAKSAGFAVCYMAEAQTVYARIIADGVDVQLRQVEAMLKRLRRGFRGYFRWQDKRLLECVRTGYATSPLLGRRRWLSHDPSPTECANFPIQGGAADLMNLRLPMIVEALRKRSPRSRIVAQVHDSGVFEVPENEVGIFEEVSREIFEAPVEIDSSGIPLTASFPIDLEVGERWK